MIAHRSTYPRRPAAGGIHRGVDSLRPTSDVDVLLHIETTRGLVAEAARGLESLGYQFAPSIDPHNTTAHRFKRGSFTGSDRRRLGILARALPDNARTWRGLPKPWRTDGQAALRILTA